MASFKFYSSFLHFIDQFLRAYMRCTILHATEIPELLLNESALQDRANQPKHSALLTALHCFKERRQCVFTVPHSALALHQLAQWQLADFWVYQSRDFHQQLCKCYSVKVSKTNMKTFFVVRFFFLRCLLCANVYFIL